MKSREKPEAVDAYVAVLPRGYYEFSGPTLEPALAPAPAPATVPVPRYSRAAKIWRRLFVRARAR